MFSSPRQVVSGELVRSTSGYLRWFQLMFKLKFGGVFVYFFFEPETSQRLVPVLEPGTNDSAKLQTTHHGPSTGPTHRTTHLKIIFFYFEVVGDIRIKLFLDCQSLPNNFKNVIKISNIDPTRDHLGGTHPP